MSCYISEEENRYCDEKYGLHTESIVNTLHDPLTNEEDKHLRKLYFKEFRHNSDVAEMLCSIMKRLEETVQCPRCGFLMDLLPCHPNQSESIRKWWEEHKERDALK